MQLLPNGNVLVNWGSEGAVTEYRADGTPIFHVYMDSGFLGEDVENYRGFWYNWTGLPHETPAIVSLGNEQGTVVYVSWNGDTETVVWRFYTTTDKFGSRRFLGESKRESFETSLSIRGEWVEKVVADAIDASGRVLVTSSVASLQQDIEPVVKGDSDEHQPRITLSKHTSGWAEPSILKLEF